MLTLLGSLIGFISSAFPDFLNIWQDRSDKKHELAILDRQMEAQKQGHNQRLEEIHVQADISESQALYKHASQPSGCLLYTSPSPRDQRGSRMPSSA